MRKGLERLWAKKGETIGEKDEKLVSGLSLIVSISLSLSLIYWSIRNGFAFFDLGFIAAIVLAAGFGVSLFTAQQKKEGEGNGKFSLFNALLMLFLLILALKFFSPQMFGFDLLRSVPFNDYLFLGTIALLVLFAIMKLFSGSSGESAGGGSSAMLKKIGEFFSGEIWKDIGWFILFILISLVLWFAADKLIGREAIFKFLSGGGKAIVWILGIVAGLAVLFGVVKLFQFLRGKGGGSFSIKAQIVPGNTVKQGTRVRLGVTIDSKTKKEEPRPAFSVAWFREDGTEILPNRGEDTSRTIDTMSFGAVREAETRKFKVEVTNETNKKKKTADVVLKILPNKEGLWFLRIQKPTTSGKTIPVLGGDIVFRYSFADPFRELKTVRWFTMQGEKVVETELKQMYEEDLEESQAGFRLPKESFEPGINLILLRGYSEAGSQITGMEDRIFLDIKAAPAAQVVRITKMNGNPVSGKEGTEAKPSEVKPRTTISFEAELVKGKAEIVWGLIQGKFRDLEIVDADKSEALGKGKKIEVTIEDNYRKGDVLYVVASPVKADGSPFDKGTYEYGQVVLKVGEEEKVGIILEAPVNSKDVHAPFNKIRFNEEFSVNFKLEDARKKVKEIVFYKEEQGKDLEIISVMNVGWFMRGKTRTQKIRINKQWAGAAKLYVKAADSTGNILAEDYAYIALTDEQGVRIVEVSGAVFDKKNRIVEGTYRKQIKFICEAVNPAGVKEYYWILSGPGIAKGKIIGRTGMPEIVYIFQKVDYPPGEYTLFVQPRDLNGNARKDVFDQVRVILKEGTLGLYILSMKKEVDLTKPVIYHAGESLELTGAIRADAKKISYRWKCVFANGKKWESEINEVGVFLTDDLVGTAAISLTVAAEDLNLEEEVRIGVNVLPKEEVTVDIFAPGENEIIREGQKLKVAFKVNASTKWAEVGLWIVDNEEKDVVKIVKKIQTDDRVEEEIDGTASLPPGRYSVDIIAKAADGKNGRGRRYFEIGKGEEEEKEEKIIVISPGEDKEDPENMLEEGVGPGLRVAFYVEGKAGEKREVLMDIIKEGSMFNLLVHRGKKYGSFSLPVTIGTKKEFVLNHTKALYKTKEGKGPLPVGEYTLYLVLVNKEEKRGENTVWRTFRVRERLEKEEYTMEIVSPKEKTPEATRIFGVKNPFSIKYRVQGPEGKVKLAYRFQDKNKRILKQGEFEIERTDDMRELALDHTRSIFVNPGSGEYGPLMPGEYIFSLFVLGKEDKSKEAECRLIIIPQKPGEDREVEEAAEEDVMPDVEIRDITKQMDTLAEQSPAVNILIGQAVLAMNTPGKRALIDAKYGDNKAIEARIREVKALQLNHKDYTEMRVQWKKVKTAATTEERKKELGALELRLRNMHAQLQKLKKAEEGLDWVESVIDTLGIVKRSNFKRRVLLLEAIAGSILGQINELERLEKKDLRKYKEDLRKVA